MILATDLEYLKLIGQDDQTQYGVDVITNAIDEIKELRAQIPALTVANEELNEECDELAQEAEFAHDETASLTNELEDANDLLANSVTTIYELEDEIRAVRNELDSTNDYIASLEDRRE